VFARRSAADFTVFTERQAPANVVAKSWRRLNPTLAGDGEIVRLPAGGVPENTVYGTGTPGG